MQTHNFKIVGGDTDSIMFCKQDMAPFSEEEQESLLQEINSLLPKEIKFANDGMFKRVVYLKTKNYIMVDESGKRKIKGSALKSSTLEPILKSMLNEFIDALIEDRQDDLSNIYLKYVKMAMNITDIKPWSKKMQLSPTTYNSTRANETKVIDAIQGTEYKSGDRIYVYTTSDDKLALAENFSGNHKVETYLEKLYKTSQRFSTVIPTKEIFVNYKLKRNQEKLNDLR